MAMLDDIKAAEAKAAEIKEKATEEAKEYALNVSAKAISDAEAVLREANSQAEKLLEKAEEESKSNAVVIIDAGKSEDKKMISVSETKIDAAVAAVFEKLK